jgi:hypothetical protein
MPSVIEKTDLLKLAEGLDVLANLLAEDARIIAVHASRLQVLDAASQMLRRCAADAVLLPGGGPRSEPTPVARPF